MPSIFIETEGRFDSGSLRAIGDEQIGIGIEDPEGFQRFRGAEEREEDCLHKARG